MKGRTGMPRTLRLPLWLGLLATVCLVSPAWGAGDWRPRIEPKVLRYDPDRDEFVYQNGVFDTRRPDLPQPDLNYYGNRLSQFRFLGPKAQSGIYGAMDDYKARRKHDPIKYQYRWR
jgi:hypothetical protein